MIKIVFIISTLHGGGAQKVLLNILNKINPYHIPGLNKAYNFATRYMKIADLIGTNSIPEMLEIISKKYSEAELKKIMRIKYSRVETFFDESCDFKNGDDNLKKLLAVDYKTYMVDDILVKVDRATMAVSLEGRDPFLDHRIVEFAASLSPALKYRNGTGKWILKSIVHKYLPKKIMERPKKGFGVPIYEWFREELKDYFLTYLSTERIDRESLFNATPIIKLRDS